MPEVMTNGSKICDDNDVEKVRRLIKHRNELREETKLNGTLNQILRKLVHKKLDEELVTHQVGLGEHGDEDNTTNFKISFSTRSKFSSSLMQRMQ